MNLLIQTKNLLIGSDEDAARLEQKDSAVILAVSDSHGNPSVIKKILEEFSERSDAFVFSGDGTQDIADIFDSLKKDKKLAKMFPPVAVIAGGNGDDSSYPVSFNPTKEKISKDDFLLQIPRTVSFTAAGKKILVTHGHIFGVYYGMSEIEKQASLDKADLVIYGHSHIASRTDTQSVTFINPGSCTLPRRSLPPSFALIEISRGQKNIGCTFYEIKISLSNGISFTPFAPDMHLHQW